MKLSATIDEAEIRRAVSDMLAREHPKTFPHGARVSFRMEMGDRPGEPDYLTATAVQANPAQGKD